MRLTPNTWLPAHMLIFIDAYKYKYNENTHKKQIHKYTHAHLHLCLQRYTETRAYDQTNAAYLQTCTFGLKVILSASLANTC